ncbi:hypothetical protein BH10PSE2_BH10PSE2_09900 [soil metagenome]
MERKAGRPRWGLNVFRPLKTLATKLKWFYFVKFWGMDIHPTAGFSTTAWFDRTNPKGVHIGEESYVAFGATILAHDLTRGLYLHTRIGRRCFIGARSIVMPGVVIGDECIVGAGAVVTKDVPPRSLVAGNPAQILRSDLKIISRYGRMETPADTLPSPALDEATASAPATAL